jgi:hypothetical protein
MDDATEDRKGFNDDVLMNDNFSMPPTVPGTKDHNRYIEWLYSINYS